MNNQSSIDLLIQEVISNEWQDKFIWHKQEVFDKAKVLQQEQAHEYANYVVGSIEQGLPPITFNDWINLSKTN
jgi:hypothetical protein